MDRKAILILACCLLVVTGGNILIQHVFKPIPVPVSTNQVSTASMPVSGATNLPGVSAASVTPEVKFVVHPEIPEETRVLSNAQARYTITSRGGGVKEVE